MAQRVIQLNEQEYSTLKTCVYHIEYIARQLSSKDRHYAYEIEAAINTIKKEVFVQDE